MLKGPRITLRANTRDDLPRYVIWLNDPEITKYLDRASIFNLDDELEWYEAQRKNDAVLHLAIDVDDVVGHIGAVSLMKINHRNQTAELGIVIGVKGEWGKGYGGEAIETLLPYAFEVLNLNRIFLRVDTEHRGAIVCYQRCGFTHEGELRQATFREGKFRNQFIMSILREEYYQRKRQSGQSSRR